MNVTTLRGKDGRVGRGKRNQGKGGSKLIRSKEGEGGGSLIATTSQTRKGVCWCRGVAIMSARAGFFSF